MLLDEIKSILHEHGYETDSEMMNHVDTMIESIRDDNQLYKLDHIIKWFNEKREKLWIFR